jgi:hypothetical protein
MLAWKATQCLHFLQYHLLNVMLSYVEKTCQIVMYLLHPLSRNYTCACLLTYSLTPCSRVLLEKLVKKFPAFYETQRFITAFTKTLPPIPILNQSICPGLRLSTWTFCNKIQLHGKELLAPRPTPKLESHPLSAVCDCLFKIFAATLHTGGHSSICNWRTHHAVMTRIHLPQDIHVQPWRLKE